MRIPCLALLISFLAALPSDGASAEQVVTEDLRATLDALRQHPDVLALKSDHDAFAARIANMAAASQTHYDGEMLEIMLLGLSVKGSGGGGGLIDGSDIWFKLDLEKGIDIYDIGTVQDDRLYMVVGGLGAPSALKENLDGLIEAIEKSMDTLAQLKGKQIGGVLSVESGPDLRLQGARRSAVSSARDRALAPMALT
jgi:hypothetical protein